MYVAGHNEVSICEARQACLEAPTGEAANKDDLLGSLADVNEAATPWRARREVRDIHIPFLIHLKHVPTLEYTLRVVKYICMI